MCKAVASILPVLLLCGKLFSTHIVGGEIFYDRLNDSSYRVTLKIYRDCLNGQAPFNGVPGACPCILTVYTGNKVLVDTFDMGEPVIKNVPPSINSPCIQPPGGVCVEEGVYTRTLTLPPKTGGYYLIHQVVFRNSTVLNLVTPNSQGSTYYTFIPGPELAAVNSSPRFNNFPPIFICNKVNFTFNHSATDPDGDQLVYSLCAPYDGIRIECVNNPGAGSPEGDPPPYANVIYASLYNGSYPIASSPAFSINPSTGALSGRPNLIGQFVVCVCVQEFKNGNLINTHYRDFQFNVRPCVVDAVAGFITSTTQCQGSTFTFTNQSFGSANSLSYLWNFGEPNITTDTSTIKNPTYTYQDTGQFVVTLIVNPGKLCSDTIQKLVYAYPQIKVQFPHQASQCFKNNQFSFSLPPPPLPSATYTWSFGSSAQPSASTLTSQSVSYSQPGKYTVRIVGKYKTCIDSFKDTVRVYAPPLAKINNLPLALCNPARVGFSNGSSSELPVSYLWLFSNGATSGSFEPDVVFSPPGIYHATLIVVTKQVCSDTSKAVVKDFTVNPSPEAGFTFSPQITTIFDPVISFMNTADDDISSWQYYFGDGAGSNSPNNEHEYMNWGDFPVTQIVTNSYNCRDTLVQTVKILPEFRFWIPNTFTPDDNLRNDVFMPVAIGVSNYSFEIYDEWGDKIFRTEDPKEGWNGYYSGKECQQDVYVWRVTFKNMVSSKNEVHYGRVHLLKNK